MSARTKSSNLLAKAFYTEHRFDGDVNRLRGWHAVREGDEVFTVFRPDGSRREMRIGEMVDKVGRVSFALNGHLRVGDIIVLVGENIIHGVLARPAGKGRWHLIDPTQESEERIDVNTESKRFGLLVEEEEGYLAFKGGRIPIVPKAHEKQLLVMKTRDKGGYEAYFNTREYYYDTDRNKLKRAGYRGVFYPREGDRPANFSEVGIDRKLHKTAVFWPSKSGGFLSGHLRSLPNAMKERELHHALENCRRLADRLNCALEDVPDAKRIQAALKLLRARRDPSAPDQGEGWLSLPFTATGDVRIFGLKPREFSRSRTPSPSPEIS